MLIDVIVDDIIIIIIVKEWFTGLIRSGLQALLAVAAVLYILYTLSVIHDISYHV